MCGIGGYLLQKQGLDFIVIGAEKCGTTSLFEYLRKHPELCLPAGKYAIYFSNEVKYAQDWTAFLAKQFPYADPACKWGSVTPQYMYGGASRARWDLDGPDAPSDVRTVPLRIRERLPDVRLIAILRDPVQRARSHHSTAVYEKWDTSARSFDQAIDELLQPDALERARREIHEITGYVVFGEYGRILSGYLDVFSREQLLVLFTAELEADPHSALSSIFEFLGVDPEFVPDNLGKHYHRGGTDRRIEWLDLYRFQAALSSNSLATKAWHTLPPTTRRRLDTGYTVLYHRSRLWNKRPSTSRNEGETETDRRLRAHFEADTALLTDLLGTAPPWSGPSSGADVDGDRSVGGDEVRAASSPLRGAPP